jgi:hypothetical protein
VSGTGVMFLKNEFLMSVFVPFFGSFYIGGLLRYAALTNYPPILGIYKANRLLSLLEISNFMLAKDI